jgi:hypothetical protein
MSAPVMDCPSGGGAHRSHWPSCDPSGVDDDDPLESEGDCAERPTRGAGLAVHPPCHFGPVCLASFLGSGHDERNHLLTLGGSRARNLYALVNITHVFSAIGR